MRYYSVRPCLLFIVHENNISHRDIKPDNMMISADGILKIVDFGVSEIFKSENDKLEKSAGSPGMPIISKNYLMSINSILPARSVRRTSR